MLQSALINHTSSFCLERKFRLPIIATGLQHVLVATGRPQALKLDGKYVCCRSWSQR